MHSNLVLLLPSWMCLSQSFSEKSRAPLSSNALSNFGLIVSQWSSCVRLSFFLVIMVHQSCDQFWDRCWEEIFLCTMKIGKKISCPLPFLRRYGSLRAVHTGSKRKADKARIQFLGARTREPHQFPELLVFDLALTKVHFLSRFLVRRVIPRWWDHDWHLEMCNSSTNWLFPQDIRTQDVRFGLSRRMEFRFQVRGYQTNVRRELQWLVQ